MFITVLSVTELLRGNTGPLARGSWLAGRAAGAAQAHRACYRHVDAAQSSSKRRDTTASNPYLIASPRDRVLASLQILVSSPQPTYYVPPLVSPVTAWTKGTKNKTGCAKKQNKQATKKRKSQLQWPDQTKPEATSICNQTPFADGRGGKAEQI